MKTMDSQSENELKKKIQTIIDILFFMLETGQMLVHSLLLVGCVVLLYEGYSSIEDIDTSMKNIGISSFGSFSDVISKQNTCAIAITVFISIYIVMHFVLNILWILKERLNDRCELKKLQMVSCILVIVASAVAGIATIVCLGVLASERNPDLDQGRDTVKSAMSTSLTRDFISDNISSTNMISNEWNKFFMKHHCCGVDAVFGTTNDFDITPWCTTSGSCQQTNSQIPRTCCKYSTTSDFTTARSGCHASVSSNSYYEMGCFRLLYEKLEKMKEARRYWISVIYYEGAASVVCMISATLYSVNRIC